jgi:nicotinate-nucleotide pyrophosphorylase (carboxylating)
MLSLLPEELDAARHLVPMALAEDLDDLGDLTSQLLIPADAPGEVAINARKPGVLSGGAIVPLILEYVDTRIRSQFLLADGDPLLPGSTIARLTGPARSLLTAERTVLNVLTLLSGTASLTASYVAATNGTSARILDTRKTLPGLRRLQKYAVRCGGGTNHRMGLYDAVLVKDNHLAWFRQSGSGSLADAVALCRMGAPSGTVIEFEVDRHDQLHEILPAGPDIVLLDNMSIEEMAAAVQLRNSIAPQVQLEASGGVTLERTPAIAATGVDRISVGALTHSAPALDIGFDWIGL